MTAPLILWEELLSDGVKAGFTTAGDRGLFNLALHAGGDRSIALENRERLCRTLGLPPASYTCAEQVHGTNVIRAGKSDKGRGRESHEDAIPSTDALITGEPGLLLNIFVADCVPIILYDRLKKAGGLCHAGWRGTAGLIAPLTVKAMAENFHSRPEDMTAYIGPSIGGCCYEVGGPVREGLEKSFSYKRNPFSKRKDSLFLDLKRANEEQLNRAGLRRENIRISPHCTLCGEAPFFSYRKSGDAAGRFSAFFTIL